MPRDSNCLRCLEGGDGPHAPDCKRNERPHFRDHGEEVAAALAEHERRGVSRLEPEGHDDPLGKLFSSSTPKPGCPGVRIDAEGHEWYSAGWLDRHHSTPTERDTVSTFSLVNKLGPL